MAGGGVCGRATMMPENTGAQLTNRQNDGKSRRTEGPAPTFPCRLHHAWNMCAPGRLAASQPYLRLLGAEVATLSFRDIEAL